MAFKLRYYSSGTLHKVKGCKIGGKEILSWYHFGTVVIFTGGKIYEGKIMKVTKIKLFLLALLAAFGIRSNIVLAEMIPSYIGTQSFRLSDDRDLSNLMQNADNAKFDYARLDDSRSQMQGQANNLSQQVAKIRSEMDQANAEISNYKISLQQFIDKLAVLNQNPTQNKDEIGTTQASIDRFNTLITNSTQALGQLKLESAPLNVQLDQINHDLQDLNRRTADARQRMINANNERESYERQLISDIQRINRNGANNGDSDGRSDGASLAQSLGSELGGRDGNNDGLSVGTTDGQNRDYKRGADQGDRDGSSRARIDGEHDGTILGTRDGNISAANREGDAAGIIRADKSDAANVGIAQGKIAGVDHAKKQGRIDGENAAENETVLKLESASLNAVKLNGPFAGSFSRRSPSYPGDFNGPNFRPDSWENKDILKRAYADGYIYTYRDETNRSYNINIDGIYNRYYDSNYQASYSSAFNRDYPDFYNQGRSDGDQAAYKRDYPIIKNNFYNQFFAQFDQNPDRSSSEYKSTYKESEANAYDRHYEEIRSANFDITELATYKANIKEQTEIFHQKRIGEVTKIYQENAILQFDSSEMLDGGINGVAKFDGIFQPGETTLHNIIIKNFGFKEANNVRIKLNNGTEVKLPSIPARSIVSVKGAGISVVDASASIGSTQTTSLQVLSKLTSDDFIEAIHFDNMGSNILKTSDVKTSKVQYPFSLTGLKLESLLLKDNKNKLHLVLANNSARAYNGELKVEVLVNSSNDIITKKFQSLNGAALNSSQELSDAEVMVSSDDDIYRDLSFSAKLLQNGVVLGLLGADLSTMAKASYTDKGKLPVLLVDSNQNLRLLLDILVDLGGSNKVSILDTSLSDLNSKVLSGGLIGKTTLVLDNESNKTISSLNTLFTKSGDSAFILLNGKGTGLDTVLGLASFKDAQKLKLDKKQLVFTNPKRADSVVGVSSFLTTTKDELPVNLELGAILALNSQELVAKIKNDINRTNFFTPNNTIKIFSLRALAEILNINIAYDKSGNIFNRDTKWAKMISEDQSLFINQIKVASAGDVQEEKLGVVLTALALKDFVSTAMSDFYDISRHMMPKIANATNKNLGNIEDSFKKSLKKFNKDLYNKAYEKVSIQRPFYIEPKPDQNN